MKNKILLLSIILCALFAAPAVAQQKPLDFSIKAYGGYGILAPGNDFSSNSAPIYSGETITGYEFTNSNLKFGQVPHFGVGVNLGLTEGISVGIDADYLTGSSKIAYTFTTTAYNGSISASYHVLSFIPNVTYQLYHQNRFSIYNTLGLVLGASTKLNFDVIGNNTFSNEVNKFGLNVGFKDAAGVKFGLAKNITGFAEVSGYFLGATPTSLTYVDEAGTTTITYKSSGSANRVETTSGGKDNLSYTQATGDPYHFSSVGLNIGIIIGIK